MSDGFIATRAGEPGLNYLNSAFKLFLHHVEEPKLALRAALAELEREHVGLIVIGGDAVPGDRSRHRRSSCCVRSKTAP